MAGRPRTMLRRVERLEVAAYELADAVFQAIPEQYRTRRNDDDYIAEVWRKALDAAISAWGRTTDLGQALRGKAGILSYGPTAKCRPFPHACAWQGGVAVERQGSKRTAEHRRRR